ncbi:hypothetical protein [Halomonas sp. G11]|jgi:hypothetical protein|nr:hypothetical protein [Halomonas sp. G11]
MEVNGLKTMKADLFRNSDATYDGSMMANTEWHIANTQPFLSDEVVPNKT